MGQSYDRRVDIAVGLKAGDASLGSQTLRNLSAEEQRVTPFRMVVQVDETKLLAAYATEPPPRIELTLTVRDDS